MRCRSASGIFQCNAVFNCRIWRFVHLTIRPLRSRWPDGITKFRSPAAPNYRKLPDSISSGSGISAFNDHCPFEVREHGQHAEQGSARWCAGIEALLMQIQFAATGLELGQEADQVLEGSTEAIDGPSR